MEEENETAIAIQAVASALHYLGTGNAGTQMGAIECLAVSVKESGEYISSALESVASALQEIAEAISSK